MLQPDYVSSADCEQVLTAERALQLAERALLWEARGQVDYPTPRALRMRSEGHPLRFHSKAVALPEIGVAGCRIVGYPVAADGRRPGAELATRMIVLMDLETGAPLAIVDEHYNYSLRTAASVAVAAARLTNSPARLGFVGAGTVATSAVTALLAAMPVSQVTMTSRTIERSDALAEHARALTDAEVRVVPDIPLLMEECDVVVTATTTREPIIRGALPRGMLLCALGSNELDADAYLSCDRLLVDDWAQTQEAADIVALIAAGCPIEDRVAGGLPGLIAGTVPGRRDADETIIVRTEGLASQDVLFAHWAWQESKAREQA
ncbi:MAG: hypothetical protein JWN09_1858 [Microbacteriaceae bacterium]|nr:hypothetical protein [Microbacteriaceae bacterium]